MIGVDTNLVVRLLTGDDPEQFAQANNVFRESEIFLPESVILETEWVLRFAYGFKPTEIAEGLRRLLGLPNVHVRDSQKIIRVIAWHEKGLDFADALHLADCHQLPEFVTFDRKFIRHSRTLGNCSVRLP